MNNSIEFIGHIVYFFMHLDQHLIWVLEQYGNWIYLLLFLIIFCETGVVVTPFLPGDSLLFVVGAMSAHMALNVSGIFLLLSLAAIAGDTVNYWVGAYVGPAIFEKKTVRFLNKEHLQKAQQFYEKHGGRTIVLARFIPIIRTFAPFVAGIAKMHYSHFMRYNIIGGILWNALFIFSGYFLGHLPVVQKNFTPIIYAMILLSLLPIVIEYVRSRRKKSV